MNPYLATLITFIAVLAFQGLMGFLTQQGLVESTLSRKIARIGAGPIYVACWMLYPDGPIGPWLASLVPLVGTLIYALIGLGIIKDDVAVKALTRTVDHREMLLGPLFSGIMFMVITVIYWRDSLVGLPALMMLCGAWIGEVVGPYIPSPQWPRENSIARSVIMVASGWLLTMLIFAFYIWIGDFSGPVSRFFWPISAIALAATLVKSLPLGDFENFAVPLICLLMGHWVF